MKVRYDKEEDILMIEVSDEPIDYAEQVDSIIVHLTKEGKPVLLEILDASQFIEEVQKWMEGLVIKGDRMDEEKLKNIYQKHSKSGCIIREWEEKVRKAYPMLTKRAREMPYDEMPIAYGELGAKIGLYPLSDLFPLKIGWICGACSEYEHCEGRPLISALVVNKETSRPGKGFWGLPGIPRHLRKTSGIGEITPFPLDRDAQRDAFWIEQLKQIDRVWKGSAVIEGEISPYEGKGIQGKT
jgi:uncharacterized protein YuzE